MKKIKYIAILSILSINANAQLTGAIRNNFLDAQVKSCFKSQRSASVNTGIEDKVLIRYCNCTGKYVADILNNQFLIEIENGTRKIEGNIIELSGRYCKNNS